MIVDRQSFRRERRARDAHRGRLGPGRYGPLVKELAGLIALALEAGSIGSPFGLEGALRHGLRAELCLQGWPWGVADLTVREILEEAHHQIKAERPTWNEGQLEWVIEGGTLIGRTRCINCHKPLPEGHHKFCGTLCASALKMRLTRRKNAIEDQAISLAIRSI